MLTEEEKKELAKYVVEYLWESVYKEAGKSLLKAAFWLTVIGLLAVAVYFGKIPTIK